MSKINRFKLFMSGIVTVVFMFFLIGNCSYCWESYSDQFSYHSSAWLFCGIVVPNLIQIVLFSFLQTIFISFCGFLIYVFWEWIHDS